MSYCRRCEECIIYFDPQILSRSHIESIIIRSYLQIKWRQCRYYTVSNVYGLMKKSPPPKKNFWLKSCIRPSISRLQTTHPRGKISIIQSSRLLIHFLGGYQYIRIFAAGEREIMGRIWIYTVCPRSSDPFYIVTYHIKWVTTSLTCCSFNENTRSNKMDIGMSMAPEGLHVVSQNNCDLH